MDDMDHRSRKQASSAPDEIDTRPAVDVVMTLSLPEISLLMTPRQDSQ